MPTDRSVSITIQGMAELNRALKGLSDKVAGDGLRSTLLGIAGLIAVKARSTVPVGGGATPGAAPQSIQPHSTARGASISWGGQAAPYMPWLDFGGTTGRGHKNGAGRGAIHRDWMGRPSGTGRYVYPAISDARDATAEAVEAAIADAARAADFEVR